MIGKVVSLSGKNTAVVSISRQWRHPLYDKAVRRDKKYHCHVEGIKVNLGDEVAIIGCRPISKLKRFKVVEVVEKNVTDNKVKAKKSV